jgi:hypothetical protein
MRTPPIVFAFTAELYSHGSWGSSDIPGKHACTMDYSEGSDAGHAYIEWDIPSLEMTESIGLTFEMRDGKRTLTDYDGIMALPAQAVHILGQLGIAVPADEGFDDEIAHAQELEGDEVPARQRPVAIG